MKSCVWERNPRRWSIIWTGRVDMSSASKTEKPTAKRLRDASRKGQTFKAKDLVVTCLTLCGITYMVFNSSLLDVMEVYRRIIASDFDVDLQKYSAMLVVVGLK